MADKSNRVFSVVVKDSGGNHLGQEYVSAESAAAIKAVMINILPLSRKELTKMVEMGVKAKTLKSE